MGAESVARAATSQVATGACQLRIPSVVKCGVMILAVKALLKARGFDWTIQFIRRRVEDVPEAASVEVETVKATEYAVAMAGALYPGRALCLEQSLVLCYLLRRHGVAAKFRMGVVPHPFTSHAWVEYRGEPINDVREHLKPFTPLPDELV